jgi:hypothetical protein
MTARLDSSLAKIGRANEHLSSLQSEARQYLASQPYKIATRRDPESRRLIYFMSEVRTTPPRLSAMIGDVIHNLRAALDHLAYQLVWVGAGKVPGSHVYFPIADSREIYLEQRRKQLKGAAPNAIAAVDALTPYRGSNNVLWKLHKLNNVDKHRVLLTAGSSFDSVNVGPQMSRRLEQLVNSAPELKEPFKFPPMDLFVRPADRLFPLETGDELFVDAPDAAPDEKLQFRFELGFGEKDIVFGDPLLETLASMACTVESIVQRFEHHLS